MPVKITNALQYIEKFLKIRTKSGDIVPLQLNPAQQKLYGVIKAEHEKGKPIRIIILKARQLGFSTLCEALLFHSSATQTGVNSLIVAHLDESTNSLFSMSRMYYEELPAEIRPMKRKSNAQELVFENPTRNPDEKKLRPGLRSKIKCSTAGGKGIARGATYKNVHLSEYAFWPSNKEATLLGILQTVPDIPGTSVFIESTANGFDEFRKRWYAAVSGESDYIPVFFAWFENPDYRTAVPPGTVWTEEEIILKARYTLDDEQLAWRRSCIRNNCSGNEDMFKQEYPACADEAFLSSGTPVFDNEVIIKRIEGVSEIFPVLRGEFTFDYDGLKISNYKFIEREMGPVIIYELPRQYFPYVIGGDTAGEGSDFFIGQVLDNTDGHQVAVLRHQFDEDTYARQMYCLGKYYNDALVGIEANYSSYPIKELERLRYPRMYVRETEDSFTHQIKKSFGFMTTSVTRPVIIAALVEIMRETPELVCDTKTLEEMLSFIYNEHRRPEAMQGEHDDCVMAMAIAHYIRTQMSYMPDLPAGQRVAWRDDMWEDYRNSSAEIQKYLIKKWGNPK